MKNFCFILCVLFCSITTFAQDNDQVTTYYLIRHAEKSTFNPNDTNPVLSSEGINRAKKWADVFAHVKLDAVYSTDYNRTKQTAKPTADSKKLPVFKFDETKMYDPAFKYNTTGSAVLVVGHSNTTPQLANMILGKEEFPNIDENNYGNLYIITVTKERTTSLLLKIN
ncbi:phosphoglycerate mutase family protein [Tenacibaculum sp. IB213877]|uniref:SixA phosphatase family protein n=1 Tax=Tenacibaculum sp. IB213877 TaxID=3097351 RepID=UPI002A5AC94E|nr:phosphoglycerate mutase family protein [Tenacibaculum sp. IB213877]MDY0779580.1 phosphoglycerate mutase family protein [Tenacibaculum sp. IB213877]